MTPHSPDNAARGRVSPAEPEVPARLAATSVLSARGARLAEGPSLAIRIARLSPVICLLAVAGVASGYLLFNRMAGGSLNDDLDEISDIVSERSFGNWLDEPVAETDVFDRAQTDTRESATPNEPARETDSGSVAPAEVHTETGRPSSSAVHDIEVSVSTAAEAVIEDPAYEHVADAYDDYRAGNFVDAEGHYREALRIEPNHRSALLGLAGVYQQTGRRTDAIRAYERVLDIEPGHTVAASAILSLRSAEAGWDSESELKHLIQRFPDADHLHYSLGAVYVGDKRWSEARRAFEAARTLVPLNPAYNYNLAVSCEQLGDLRCARAHYRSALDNADNFNSIDRAAVERHLDRLSATLRAPL